MTKNRYHRKSGPDGLACANTLNSLGYKVSVFVRSDKIGNF